MSLRGAFLLSASGAGIANWPWACRLGRSFPARGSWPRPVQPWARQCAEHCCAGGLTRVLRAHSHAAARSHVFRSAAQSPHCRHARAGISVSCSSAARAATAGALEGSPALQLQEHAHPQGITTQAAAATPRPESGLVEWWRSMYSALGTIALILLVVFGTPTIARADSLFPFLNPSPPASSVPATLEMKAPKPSASDLSPEEVQTVELFLQSTPSVVNIANIASRQDVFSMDVQQVPQGMGSGFVWDMDGHIVTNFHVIRGATDIKVALIDSSVYPAKLIGGDPDKDVAVLKLDAPPEKLAELKPVTLGSSAGLQVGQKVYAIGNPFGLDHTLTQGIVSGLGRELATPGLRGVPIKNVIQTDAAINPGNSGGVLLNSRGHLIGINTAIADPTGRGASSGVGFAIPIDTVQGLVEQILKFGRVVRPVLGITIAPPQTLRQIGEDGVLILEVPYGTPAAKAGLKGTYRDERGRLVLGDIITGIEGRVVKLQRDLFEMLDEKRPGDRIKVEVLRDGQRRNVDIVLGGRDVNPAD